LFLGILAAFPASAQLATFWGQITDPEGTPVPGVDIEIATLKGPPLVHRGRTNELGEFRIPIPVQSYDFRYKLVKEGFATQEGAIEAGRLRTGETSVRQNFELRPDDGTGDDLVQLSSDAGERELRGSARAAYNEAAEHFNVGDLDAAEKSFQKALKEDPDLTAAHVALAEIYLQQRQGEQAVASAQRALEANAEDRNALQIQYDAYRLLEQQAEAEQALERLVQLGDSPQVAVRVFNLGVEAMRAGELDQAIERFEQAVRLDADLLKAREALTTLYMRQDRLQDALGQAEIILAEDPLNPVGQRVFDEAERREAEAEAAAEAPEPAQSETQDPMAAKVEEAEELLADGEPERAKELLEEILEEQPKTALAHYHLARYFIGAGDNAQAKKHLERFLKLAPRLPESERARQLLAVL
jgi:Tfp pilus assembly protein PilF